ncbi:DEAD/DEAH box helicase [Actinocorallia sp. A-T 12471]|uniref:DEAD/DEAH box helicase n=1 Tax=Actinocorallia sp. A-T 12471 TaxID=3089813 RepID=UPI0029CC6F3C|nr:DEAD/DEAH box helicase family protein [Actinocorallia sp. A-T 12471]MDX6741437.1 DEAD/DEAH box helicase family protein [Actinocorallia sp. A-T 12471]
MGEDRGEAVWADILDFAGNRVTQLLVAEQSGSNAPSADNVVRITPKDVVATFGGALRFDHEALRRSQRGALYSVLGHWTAHSDVPATVVMPTGTGKTETMLALLVAERIERLIVLVPSDSLREQIAAKFERLGVLQELGIVNASAARPSVGRMTRSFSDAAAAADFASACNVVVATPQILNTSTAEARNAILDACTHLFVDEAHHVEARTWTTVRERFADRPVLQFTATPFREDGKHMAGKIVYTYPLRAAQSDKVFAPIDYYSILDFDDTDDALARGALDRLGSDLAAGYDHVLMARAKSIPRAKELAELYRRLGPEYNPVLIYSSMRATAKKAALDALHAGETQVIVCVNMLGEGFDLPSLKIAAVHDPQKSLSVTLQFIGRFARTKAGSGEPRQRVRLRRSPGRSPGHTASVPVCRRRGLERTASRPVRHRDLRRGRGR